MNRIPLLIMLMAGLYCSSSLSYSQSTSTDIMKELTIPKIPHSGDTSLIAIKEKLVKYAPLHTLDVINWPEYSYQPDVQFRIGHTGDAIWLTFYVTEDHVLARHMNTNSPTHKDSCVEFFLSPRKDENYYNFEFNAIGTTHLAYGNNVHQRKFIEPELISTLIRSHSSLGSEPVDDQGGRTSWDLTVVIPAAILIHDPLEELTGHTMRANFFKCGDETYTPHFLSWNPISTERPSFHQPTYFGRVVFE